MAESFSMQIPSDVLALMEVLENAGHEAYVVGGCVRDAMLGKVPHDYDMCTSATPTQIKEAMRAAGYKTYDTGIQHGTISVNNNDELYEITTFRVDGEYSDGRHPDSVTFTKNLLDDLARRDFTINAMAYNYKVGLVDPYEGSTDLEKKIIRCVGNPIDRMNEDALRILRGVRLGAKYGFTIEPLTLAAMEETKSLMDMLAPERIQSELAQLITISQTEMLETSKTLLAQIMPEIELTYDFPEDMYCRVKNLWKLTLQTLDNVWEDLVLKIAALLQNIGRQPTYQVINGVGQSPGYCEKTVEMADKILRDLKFDNQTRKNVLDVLRYQDKPITKDPAILKAVMNKIGVENTRRLTKLLIANTIAYQKVRCVEGMTEEEIKKENDKIFDKLKKLYQTEAKISEIVIDKEPYRLQDLAIKGNEVLELGVPEPKDVGVILNTLLKDVLKHPEHNTKEFLLDKAEKEIEKLEQTRDNDFTLFDDIE